ncbi:hypothetical protein PCE1_003407 [Barthelona sp. PCE]
MYNVAVTKNSNQIVSKNLNTTLNVANAFLIDHGIVVTIESDANAAVCALYNIKEGCRQVYHLDSLDDFKGNSSDIMNAETARIVFSKASGHGFIVLFTNQKTNIQHFSYVEYQCTLEFSSPRTLDFAASSVCMDENVLIFNQSEAKNNLAIFMQEFGELSENKFDFKVEQLESIERIRNLAENWFLLETTIIENGSPIKQVSMFNPQLQELYPLEYTFNDTYIRNQFETCEFYGVHHETKCVNMVSVAFEGFSFKKSELKVMADNDELVCDGTFASFEGGFINGNNVHIAESTDKNEGIQNVSTTNIDSFSFLSVSKNEFIALNNEGTAVWGKIDF